MDNGVEPRHAPQEATSSPRREEAPVSRCLPGVVQRPPSSIRSVTDSIDSVNLKIRKGSGLPEPSGVVQQASLASQDNSANGPRQDLFRWITADHFLGYLRRRGMCPSPHRSCVRRHNSSALKRHVGIIVSPHPKPAKSWQRVVHWTSWPFSICAIFAGERPQRSASCLCVMSKRRRSHTTSSAIEESRQSGGSPRPALMTSPIESFGEDIRSSFSRRRASESVVRFIVLSPEMSEYR